MSLCHGYVYLSLQWSDAGAGKLPSNLPTWFIQQDISVHFCLHAVNYIEITKNLIFVYIPFWFTGYCHICHGEKRWTAGNVTADCSRFCRCWVGMKFSIFIPNFIQKHAAVLGYICSETETPRQHSRYIYMKTWMLHQELIEGT